MTPQQYAEIKAEQEAIIKEARQKINDAFEAACQCPVPENLRPAEPSDVIEGAIIWKPEWPDNGRKWSLVEGVETPGDPFHGWTDDGAFYGIHGGFVKQNTEASRPADRKG